MSFLVGIAYYNGPPHDCLLLRQNYLALNMKTTIYDIHNIISNEKFYKLNIKTNKCSYYRDILKIF